MREMSKEGGSQTGSNPAGVASPSAGNHEDSSYCTEQSAVETHTKGLEKALCQACGRPAPGAPEPLCFACWPSYRVYDNGCGWTIVRKPATGFVPALGLFEVEPPALDAVRAALAPGEGLASRCGAAGPGEGVACGLLRGHADGHWASLDAYGGGVGWPDKGEGLASVPICDEIVPKWPTEPVRFCQLPKGHSGGHAQSEEHAKPRGEGFDPLHPTGRCTCGGENRCAWCVGAAARELPQLVPASPAGEELCGMLTCGRDLPPPFFLERCTLGAGHEGGCGRAWEVPKGDLSRAAYDKVRALDGASMKVAEVVTVREGGAGRVTWKLTCRAGMYTGSVLVAGNLAASFTARSSESVLSKLLAYVDAILDPRDTRYMPPAVQRVASDVAPLMALNTLSTAAQARLGDLHHRLARLRGRLVDEVSEWLDEDAGAWEALSGEGDVNPRMIERARQLHAQRLVLLFERIGGAL